MPEFNWTPELPSVPPLGGRQKRAPLSLVSDPPVETSDEPQFNWKPEPVVVKPASTGDVYDVNPNRIRSIPKRDTPWSINDFDQIGSWYRQTYGKAIPTRAYGQGNIHNSQGWDHRNAVDLGINPNTPEGQAVVQYLRDNRIPFQAFNRAVKNPTTGRVSSTGPHIHVGEPSHSTTQQFTPGTRMTRTNDVPDTSVTPTRATEVLDHPPEFNWTPEPIPVPEHPDTLDAQAKSASRPDSPKLGILITPGERPRRIPAGFEKIETPKGNLYYDVAKVKAAGITDPVAEMDSILGTVEPVSDTSKGEAVVARDPQTGTELEAKIATTPETQAAQAKVNQAMHPGSVQSIERPHQVIQRRRPRSQQRPSTGFMDRAGQVLRRFDSSDVRRVGQPALSPEAASAAGDVRALIAGGSEGLTRRRQAQAGPSARPVASTQRASTISSADARALGLPQRTQPARSLESGQVRYTAPAHQIEAAKAAAQKRQQLLSSMTPEEKQRFDTDVQDIVHAGRVSSGLQSGLSGSIARTDMAAAGALRPLDWLLGKEDISGAGRAGELRMAALDEALAQMPMEKRDSLLRQIAEVGGGTPLDLARLAALSKLPGGGVTGFAADTGLQAIGEHQPASEVVRRTASGAAQGTLFGATHGLPVLGRAATVGGGSQLIASAMGDTPSVHGAVTNALFTALPQGGRERTGKDSLPVAPVTESNNVARSISPESRMTDANLNARIERIQSMPKSQQTDIRRNELTRLQAEQQRRQVAPEPQPEPIAAPVPENAPQARTAPETAIPASPAVDVTNRPTATPEARQESPVQPPVSTAGEVKEPWRMTRDEYLATVNPGNKRLAPSDRPTVLSGDLEDMAQGKVVVRSKLASGEPVQILRDNDGTYYAKVGDQTVGYISKLGTGEVDMTVAQAFQRKGIGQILNAAFRKENPLYPSGGLTEAGEKTVAKTHAQFVRQALAEGKPVPPEVLADYPDLASKESVAVGTEPVKPVEPIRPRSQARVGTRTEPIKPRPVEPKPVAEPPKPSQADPRFANNKLFTNDVVEAARARIRAKAKGNQLNTGLDPELAKDYAIVGAAHIEAGARKFAEWSKHMVNEFGDAVKPHLTALYAKARDAHDYERMPEAAPASERGTSKIGRSVEAKAIEQQLAQSFGDTAGYDKINKADQADRVDKLFKADPELAKRIIRGEEPVPEGILDTSMIVGMENIAQRNGDVQTLMDIAKSPLVSKNSRAAQELGMAAERSPDSAAMRIKELRDARRQAAQDRLVNEKVDARVKAETAKIQKTVKNTARRETTNKRNWQSFIESIQC